MRYTKDFVRDVLSVIDDPVIKNDILIGKIDIGKFLSERAYKGINSKIVVDCININDLDYLENIACKQERIDALYEEYVECYVLKQGPTLKQIAIEKELSNNSRNKKYFKARKLVKELNNKKN